MSSTTSNRRRDPGTMTGETIGLLVFVLVVLVGGGSLYAAVRLGHQLDGTAGTLPSDPFAVVIGLFTGKVAWPASGTWIIAAAAVVVLGLATLILHTAGTRRQAIRQAGLPDADAVALRNALVPASDRHDDVL